MIDGGLHSVETFAYLVLHELRSSLVPLVGVLFEDSTVVLLRVLAAFEDHQDEAMQLRISVVRKVHMCNRLEEGQHT